MADYVDDWLFLTFFDGFWLFFWRFWVFFSWNVQASMKYRHFRPKTPKTAIYLVLHAAFQPRHLAHQHCIVVRNPRSLTFNTLSPKSKFTPLSPIGIISTFFQGWKDGITFLIRPAIRKFNWKNKKQWPIKLENFSFLALLMGPAGWEF